MASEAEIEKTRQRLFRAIRVFEWHDQHVVPAWSVGFVCSLLGWADVGTVLMLTATFIAFIAFSAFLRATRLEIKLKQMLRGRGDR